MKRKSFVLGVFLASMMLFTTAQAESKINIIANEEPVVFVDQDPVIIEEREMVPVRDVFEQLGFVVEWDEVNGKATLTDENNTLVIGLNEEFLLVNEIKFAIEVPAQIVNERILLPLRAVSESLGSEVNWDEETSTAVIVYTGEAVVVEGIEEEPEEEPVEGEPVEPTEEAKFYQEMNEVPDFGILFPEAVLEEKDTVLEEISKEDIYVYTYADVTKEIFDTYVEQLVSMGFDLEEAGTLTKEEIKEAMAFEVGEQDEAFWELFIDGFEQVAFTKETDDSIVIVSCAFSGEIELEGESFSHLAISFLKLGA